VKKIFVLLFFSPLPLFSQQGKIDSLKKIIASNVSVNLRIDAWNELAYSSLSTDSASTADYIANAFSLEEKADYPKGKARTLVLRGHLNLYSGNHDKAISFYLDAIKQSSLANDSSGIANEMNSIGNAYYEQQNYKKSLEYFSPAAEIYKRENDTTNYSSILNNIGATLFALGKDDSTLYDSALQVYTESLRLAELMNENSTILNALNNIGNFYNLKKNYAKAIEFLSRSLTASEKIGDKRGIALATFNLSNNYDALGEHEKSIAYGYKALSIAASIKAEDLEKDIYETLASSYAAIGKFDSAYFFQQHFSTLSQQVLNEERSKQIGELESKYKNEQKQKIIEVLHQKNADNWIIIYSVSGAGAIVLLLTILLFKRYKTNRKTTSALELQKKIVDNKNTELERLSLVAKATDNIVLIMDANGKVEWANESFSRLNHITIEELKRKKGETIFEISNNPQIREIIETATREKRSVVYESLNLNNDGERIWESTTLTPIFDDNGKLHKLIIVDSDVTQRKNDEETIKQKNKDITDSILYAKRIQQALLPGEKYIDKNLSRLKKNASNENSKNK
jgi:PAS domain S-box-containing protein